MRIIRVVATLAVLAGMVRWSGNALAAPAQDYVYEGTLEYGDYVYDEVTTEEGDIWYLWANAGDVISIYMEDYIGDGNSSGLDTLLVLWSPDGDVVAESDDYDDQINVSYIVSYRIPQTGEYMINADGYSENTGGYYLDVTLESAGSGGSGGSGGGTGSSSGDYLDPDLEAVVSVNLSAGFSPDPYRPSFTLTGDVNIADSFNGSDCRGYANAAPDYQITWSGTAAALGFFVGSIADTTLVVRDPDGNWYCSDDFGDTFHPYIGISSPRSGTYSVWVGRYFNTTDVFATLYVTDSGHNPANYFSSEGSGDSSGGSSGGTAADSDGDGITDSYELYLAEAFFPVYEFDEEEHNPITGNSGIYEDRDVMFLWQVSPVLCGVDDNEEWFYLEPLDSTDYMPSSIANRTSYLLTVVAVYQYDYLPYDPPVFGDEEDLFAHYGDTERVRLCIVDRGDTIGVDFVQINRHHERALYLGYELDVVDGSHIYLYVSEGKHATYISDAECEGAVSLANIFTDPSDNDPFDGETWQGLGWDEDCAGGEVIYPTVDPTLNVGEYVSGANVGTWNFGNETLSEVFPGEAIWYPYSSGRLTMFCGGYDLGAILAYFEFNDPHTVVGPGLYKSPVCGGSIYSKWWKPGSDL